MRYPAICELRPAASAPLTHPARARLASSSTAGSLPKFRPSPCSVHYPTLSPSRRATLPPQALKINSWLRPVLRASPACSLPRRAVGGGPLGFNDDGAEFQTYRDSIESYPCKNRYGLARCAHLLGSGGQLRLCCPGPDQRWCTRRPCKEIGLALVWRRGGDARCRFKCFVH